jgi:5-methyltetrahydropteroyltriglutamate--homocysteine methyltransferase
MKRSTDRILTTHVGGLRRPDDLMHMLAARDAGQAYDRAALAQRVRSATTDIVHEQVAAGIDVVNDGEFPKISWMGYFHDRLTGIEWRQPEGTYTPFFTGRDTDQFPGWFALAVRGGGPAYSHLLQIEQGPPTMGVVFGQAVCGGPLKYVGHTQVQSDISDLKAARTDAVQDLFLSAIGPSMLEWTLPNRYYKTDEEYVFAIADAMHSEYQAITDAGIVLQLDEPTFTTNWGLHPFSKMTLAEYRRWLEVRVAAMNHALRGIPPEMVRLHFCWGSWHAPHGGDIPLRDVLDLILEVNAGAISVEASNPRHDHEWQVWKDIKLPEGRILVPGVIGHYTDYIEAPELVAERLIKYASVVGRENVIAGTDCGIGSRVGHPEICWAKFRAMAEGARLASQQLWG